METDKGDVTILLGRLAEGDRSAEDALMPRVYAELHRIAQARLRAERSDHTLQPTALVHEVYLRLCGTNEIDWQDRGHFFCVAGRLMRRVLVDHARRRNAGKRNSGERAIPLEDVIAISPEQTVMALEIDDLLQRLAEINPRQAQVVEMRFFAGLSEEEMALALGVNTRTVRRDWLMARAWLHGQLK